jgi:DNA adenine methylase
LGLLGLHEPGIFRKDRFLGFCKRENKVAKTLCFKKEAFLNEYADRLKYTQIECDDAIKIIQRYDSPETFFYLDPPYFNSDCGHYKGYSEADYLKLLEALCSVKGKFLLSSYPSDLLLNFIKTKNWHFLEKNKKVNVSHRFQKQKTEMMVCNYDPHAVLKFKKPAILKPEKLKKGKTGKREVKEQKKQ